MRPSLILSLALICFASSLAAAPGAIRCGKLLDVRSGRELNDQVILFDDQGIITSVGAANSASRIVAERPKENIGSMKRCASPIQMKPFPQKRRTW